MKAQVVMFDLGGVLVNVETSKCWQALANASGHSVADVQRLLSDPKPLELFELGQMSALQFVAHINTQLGMSWELADFAKAWNGMLSERRDVTWLLERLKTRYHLLVLSNTNVLHDEYVRRTWPSFGVVRQWIMSYQIGYRKPEPEMYQFALQQADAPPHATVYVDDLEENVSAARDLGIPSIHFTDGLKLEQELRAAGLHV